MRIFYPNLIDSASVITGSSQASSDLSASNVAQEHPSKVWRTATSVSTETVTFDLGSSISATAAIIYAHTLTGSDSAIQIRKSTDNFAANDVLVASFTYAASKMLVLFSSASSRYWRITFTKSAAGVSRDIGRVFIGNYVTIPLQADGFEISPIDMSQTERSEGLQMYSARRGQYRSAKLSMEAISQSEAALLKTFCETVGTFTPFFIVADEGFPSDESGEVLYLKATKLPSRKTTGFDSSGNLAWSGELTAEEEQ